MDRQEKKKIILFSILAGVILLIIGIGIGLGVQPIFEKQRQEREEQEKLELERLEQERLDLIQEKRLLAQEEITLLTSPFTNYIEVGETITLDKDLAKNYMQVETLSGVIRHSDEIITLTDDGHTITITGKAKGVSELSVTTTVRGQNRTYTLGEIHVEDTAYSDYTRINSAQEYSSLLERNPNGKYILNADLDFSGIEFPTIQKFDGVLLNPLDKKIKNIQKTLIENVAHSGAYSGSEDTIYLNDLDPVISYDTSNPITSFLFVELNGYVEGLSFDTISINVEVNDKASSTISMTYSYGNGNIKDIEFKNTTIDAKNCKNGLNIILTGLVSARAYETEDFNAYYDKLYGYVSLVNQFDVEINCINLSEQPAGDSLDSKFWGQNGFYNLENLENYFKVGFSEYNTNRSDKYSGLFCFLSSNISITSNQPVYGYEWDTTASISNALYLRTKCLNRNYTSEDTVISGVTKAVRLYITE